MANAELECIMIIFSKKALTTLTLAVLCLLVAIAACADVNVKDLGAVGDGKADDTAAFETAIAKGKEVGQAVAVPKGTYRITRMLTLSAQELTGANTPAWGADATVLPVILVEATDGPCVRLTAGGAVHGLQFTYDWAGKDPSPRPPTIELAGVGCRVSEVKIYGAWDAIIGNGDHNPARSTIEKCFIVDVQHIGVQMTGTYDVTWISRVEVWSPTSKTFPGKGIGFLFGKNDVLLVSDCFVFRASVAYQFVDDIPGSKIKGGTWGSLSNCVADFCGTGVEINGKHTVSITGGSQWTHWGGLAVKGSGSHLRLTGCELAANGGPALDVQGGDVLAVSGCQMRREAAAFTAPAVRITGGQSTVITGCVITSSSKGIEVKKGLKGVVLGSNAVRENVKSEEKPANSP